MTLFTGDLITKDPNADRFPLGIDWTTVCASRGSGVTVVGSVWEVDQDELLTMSDDSIVVGSLQTQVRVSAGTRGIRYGATNRVTFSDGGTDDRTIYVFIEDT